MTPLFGLDVAFLYLETPETPMHVGSVHRYDVPRGQRTDFFERARHHLESRLHLTSVFRRRLATLPFELACYGRRRLLDGVADGEHRYQPPRRDQAPSGAVGP